MSMDQILQTVLATAWRTNGQWNERTGYDETNPTTLLTDDPSQYPEGNPFLKESSRFVFHENDLCDYYYGSANPRKVVSNDWYVYCDIDEESTLSEGHGYEVCLGASPPYRCSG